MTSTTATFTPSGIVSMYPGSPSLPPPYTEHPRDVELHDWTSSDSRPRTPISVDAGPSRSSLASFRPTVQLQVQSEGKALHSFPTPPRPTPIAAFTLTPDGKLHRPLYLSLRPKRSSGSCHLAHADDDTETPLTSTTYRFGPGRPPVVRVHDASGSDAEEIEINSTGVITRSQSMRTSLGTFQWRYASATEKATGGADNLLVLERMASLEDGGREHQQRTRVAQLVRNEKYRTPGTHRSDAGNGGRLMLDLRSFDEKAGERMQMLVVTTAIVMLKKEVDRRRRDGPYSLWWL